MRMNPATAREHLKQILDAAIAAVHPRNLMCNALSLHGDRLQAGEEVISISDFSRIYVAGAGKATGEMAIEAEAVLGELIHDGVVAVKDFPPSTLKYIRPIVAGHPVPDANSVVAAKEIRTLVEKLTTNDLLIFLLSGGASSLVTDIPAFTNLADMNAFYKKLINSGASIHEVNTVRKHLSQIKGGNLARLCKGTLITLIISDVPDDDLSVIGSGPTVADNSSFAVALNILDKYNLRSSAPQPVIDHLTKGVNNMIPANPGPGDKAFKRTRNMIIGNLHKAIQAAGDKAAALGYEVHQQQELVTGHTEEEAATFVNRLDAIKSSGNVCLIAGGETSLHVQGQGKGGRSQHFALAALSRLKNNEQVFILSAATDGSDGPTDAAGGFADPLTWQEAISRDLDCTTYLNNNDAYHFLQSTGSLLKTGATGTNVMDIIVGLKIMRGFGSDNSS